MADTTDNTTTDDKPGDLRKQLDDANKVNRENAARIAAFEQDEQLREAGLGHLSKRQRRIVIRELQEEGTDFDPEAAKDMAKELGYKTEADPPPTTTTTQSNGDQGNSQGTDTNAGQGGDDGDEDAEDALTAIALMDRARRQSAASEVSNDFSTDMKKTKNKEELTELIRTKGPRHGIVHEWDVP
jgi:hypothetical protein